MASKGYHDSTSAGYLGCDYQIMKADSHAELYVMANVLEMAYLVLEVDVV